MPDQLLSRSLAIDMRFHPEGRDEISPNDPRIIEVRRRIHEWAPTFQRPPVCEIPFVGRDRDNFRPPIEIADTLGYGATARAAALAIHSPTEDLVKPLLFDICNQVFEQGEIKSIWTPELLDALHQLPNSHWDEFRGLDGSRETMTAADGRKTIMARLSAFTVDSFVEPLAEAGIFQRFSVKRNCWVDIDPPLQLVRMVLARDRCWAFPRVGGVITTPTLRCDGSLLATPGYDPRSELYLLSGLQLPPIPERPTREQAETALKTIKDLFTEFSFQRRDLDCSVAISGLLTAQLRGSLPTAPIYLVCADTPGTGKSFLVDVIATIASGRLCPVITASKNAEETEKRLGSVLLSGVPIVSLDNCTHDLSGELLCQLTERPIVKIRVLGRSEMPDCECHTAVFCTGNNITFKGDMVRRGLVCRLEALDERPELRAFQRDALEIATANRSIFVAAVLTMVRAYFAAGAPRVCGPLGSYAAWSRMVRSPLVWLGEPDPIKSMDDLREEDSELANIRELFELWLAYDLDLGADYTTAQIVEVACRPPAPNDYAPQTFIGAFDFLA